MVPRPDDTDWKMPISRQQWRRLYYYRPVLTFLLGLGVGLIPSFCLWLGVLAFTP